MLHHKAFLTSIVCVMLHACGPGAGDRSPITSAEATMDSLRNVSWAKAAALGPPLLGAWKCSGTCSNSGIYSGAVPPTGVKDFRGTYGGSGDEDAGVIVWEGTVPEGVATIAIPVVAGSETVPMNVSVSVEGASTYFLPVAPNGWKLWRLHLKERGGSRAIAIRAIDPGGGWARWVALGAPLIVRDRAL